MPSLSKWSPGDRRRFSDRDLLRAQTVPAKRNPGPSPDEWDDPQAIEADQYLERNPK